MKIMIDIPEEVKQKIDENLDSCDLDIYDCVMLATRNGTLLPKGHGDLIDRKELLKQPMDTANYPSNYVHVAYTIIPADKYCDANPYEKYDMVDPQESEE